MTQVQLYQYAVLLQPKEDADGNETDPGAVLVEPTTVLAQSTGQVNIIASRAIPEANVNDLERLTLVVRPF